MILDLKLRTIKMDGGENSRHIERAAAPGRLHIGWHTKGHKQPSLFAGLIGGSIEAGKPAWLRHFNLNAHWLQIVPTISISITKTHISRLVPVSETISISITGYLHFNCQPSAFRLRAICILITRTPDSAIIYEAPRHQKITLKRS